MFGFGIDEKLILGEFPNGDQVLSHPILIHRAPLHSKALVCQVVDDVDCIDVGTLPR